MKLFMLLFMINYNETLVGSWKGSIRQGLPVLSNDLFHLSFCLWVFSWNWIMFLTCGMVLETHMKMCMTKPDYFKILFYAYSFS